MLTKLIVLAFLIFNFTSNTFALVIDRVEMNLADPDQKVANIAVSKIELAMGYRLNIPAILQNTRRAIDPYLQTMLTNFSTGPGYALTTSVYVDQATQWWSYNASLTPEKCLILFAPGGYLSAGITRKSITAHEAFHCFQYQIAGSGISVSIKPDWLIEGSAMFAGEDFVEESTPLFGESYLSIYVAEIKPIFERSYDAYPFFLHLKKEGVNAYQIIKRLLEVENASNIELWQLIVNNVPHDALITWASSFARIPEWGRDWNLKVTTFTPDAGFNFPFTASTTDTLPLALPGVLGLPRHDEITLVENKVTKVSIENGVGAIHYFPEGFPNGRSVRLKEGEAVQFCMGENCDCPGSEGGIRTFKVTSNPIFIASVSTRENHIVHIEEGELFCCGNTGQFDSRMIGTWSTGVTKILNMWAAWPGVPGTKVNTGSGTVEFTISPQGNFVKSYREVKFKSVVTNGRDVGNFELELLYEVTGCLKTRAIDANKGWLYLTDILDQTEWISTSQQKQTQPVFTKHGHGDWFQFSVCVQGANGCSSTFYFEDNKLRFNGGGGIAVYDDLERIAD
jgi:hypothetical protein